MRNACGPMPGQGGASGRHMTEAAKYQRGLCRAIIQGITPQLRADSLLKDGSYGVQAPDDDAAVEQILHGTE